MNKGCYVIFTPTHCLHSDKWNIKDIIKMLTAIQKCGITDVEYHISLDVSDEKMLEVYREIDKAFDISRTDAERMEFVKSVCSEKKLYKVANDSEG